MSVVYCRNCDRYIDTDFNAEHFTEGECATASELDMDPAEYQLLLNDPEGYAKNVDGDA